MLLKRSYLTLALLGAIVLQPVSGQTSTAPIKFVNQEAVTSTLFAAPNFGSSSSSSSNPLQWLKVEWHYQTTPLVTKDYPFVDSVQFKVWVEGFDLYAKDTPAGAKGVSVALTGDVTYINVQMDRDIYGVMYVNPTVLARYASDRGVEDFTRKFDVHVEAYVNGQLVDMFDKNKEQDKAWFKPLRPVPGLISRQNESPFISSDTNKYPMIKPETPAGAAQ